MLDATWPLWAHIMSFLIAAGAIGVAGTKLASFADRLADRTGLGEAVVGTLVLGLTTVLPGMAASMTAAIGGHPTIAVSNALGGASPFRRCFWPSPIWCIGRPTSSMPQPRPPTWCRRRC